jgi:hypothetical protein
MTVPSIPLSLSTNNLEPVTRPEIELLLCCARTKIAAGTAERIKSLVQQEIDWEYLLKLAAAHAVLPLLYQSLSATSPEAIPQGVLNQLKHYFHQNALRNLSRTGEMIRLIDLLKQHDIPAIPFKGPVLAAFAYGDTALRQFDDLDILVRPQDFLKAKDVLIAAGGYQPAWQPYFLTEAQEAAHLRSSCECSLTRKDGKVDVDLHQELVGGTFFSYPLTFDTLWEQLEAVSAIACKLLSLPAEDLLIYLCIHGAKSFWGRLSWICDIAELIGGNQCLDWEKVIKKANLLHAERMLLLGLLLARDLLEAPLPESIWEKIQTDIQSQQLAIQIRQRVLSGTYGLTKGFNLEMFFFQFHVLERSQERLRFCFKYCIRFGWIPVRNLLRPTSKDRSFLPLPYPLYGLYYFIRPVRLAIALGLTTRKAYQRKLRQKGTQ